MKPLATRSAALNSALALVVIVSVTSAVTVACTARPSGNDAQPARNVIDLDSLIKSLRDAGFHTERADTISQPFFTPPAMVVRVNDEEMQVYQYTDEIVAASDAARVNSSGRSVGTNQVGWIAPPHFFRRQNLIVVYLGSNAAALKALSELLGGQFAGS